MAVAFLVDAQPVVRLLDEILKANANAAPPLLDEVAALRKRLSEPEADLQSLLIVALRLAYRHAPRGTAADFAAILHEVLYYTVIQAGLHFLTEMWTTETATDLLALQQSLVPSPKVRRAMAEKEVVEVTLLDTSAAQMEFLKHRVPFLRQLLQRLCSGRSQLTIRDPELFEHFLSTAEQLADLGEAIPV
jgi:hypothetical protein